MLRWLVLPVFLVLAVACSNSGNDGSADGGGGASVCDGKASCNECTACANQILCAGQMNQCQQSSACTGLDQCVAICGADVSCKNDCFTNNPSGVSLYNAWRTCLYCDQCPSDCAGYMTCN
jgi:hypothetical protein